jgi:hypothetical protein
MEIAIHVQVLVRLQIAANAVTDHATHVRHQIVQIVHPVHTVIDQSVAMIVVQVQIVQQAAHTEIATHVQVPIVHAEKILMVAIAHAQVMIAMRVHHAMIVAVRVTANAVAVQIVLVVVSQMIAKSVHAVALAKSE